MKRKKLTVPDAVRRAAAAVGGLLCATAVAALAVTGGAFGASDAAAGGTAPGGAAARGTVPRGAGPAGTSVDEVRAVPVAAAETGLVCPGPAELEQPDVGDDQFSASPVETTTSLTAAVLDGAPGQEPTLATLDDVAAELTGPLDQGAVAAVREGTVPGARQLRVTPGGSTYAAGTVASVTTQGDLRGLVAGPCAEPAVEHWLVGGSTAVGSSGRLVLQNPGGTPATVTLEAWGASGPVALGSQSLVVVPPGQEVVTMLEAVAPDQSRLALHVTAEGGRVGAYVQHHRIEGLVPAGADLITGGGAPSSATAVSGVVSTGEAVDDPHAPRLDLLAPGAEAGTARLAVLGPDGPVRLRGGEEVALEPGQVTTLPLGGLPEGTYTVVVDADVPVVAGAAVDREGAAAQDAVIDEDPYDRAWLAGQAVPGGGAGSVGGAVPGGGAGSVGGAVPGGGAGSVGGAVPGGGAGSVGGAGSADGAGSVGGAALAGGAGSTGEIAAAGGASPAVADGAVAVPPDVAYAVTLSGVPNERDPERIEDADGSTAVTLRGVGPDGDETWTRTVDVPTGETVEVAWDELAELGDTVAVVVEQPADEPPVVWSVRLADLADTSLFSVLTPTAPLGVGGDVRVRRVDAAG